ncbi:MAG TPA: helix-turn-helix transcriptional regulator [Micromonospora sp.]
MVTFGAALRTARTTAELSLRELSKLVSYDFGYIGQIERGQRSPSRDLAVACDRALDAGGTLIDVYERQTVEDTMRRRTVLQALSALSAASAVGATSVTASLEALRHGVSGAYGCDYDEWAEIADDYGRLYYRLPAADLLRQVTADLTVLQALIAADTSHRRRELDRVAVRLSVVVALILTAGGESLLARRWWRTARRAADQSGDPDSRVLAAAWDVVNGCYDGRQPAEVVGLSEAAVPMCDGRASAAVAGLLAGRAQALALAGRCDEAVTVVRQVREVAERLSAEVVGDAESLWGWPEHRLLHTESFVYTYLGDTATARQAQVRALTLYPASQVRLRTQVQLHGAACDIRDGHVTDGLRQAADLLDALPPDQHNRLVREVARQVLAVVPDSDRHRPAAVELAGRLTEPLVA